MTSKGAKIANKRLANKVIWALEDIVGFCRNAQDDWETAMKRAEKQMDPQMLLALARIRDQFALIERYAKAARNGEYAGDYDVD